MKIRIDIKVPRQYNAPSALAYAATQRKAGKIEKRNGRRPKDARREREAFEG